MQIPNPNEVRPIDQLPKSATNDVLHIPPERKMTPEEIAKAVAHHNKHHKEKTAKDGPAPKAGRKSK